MTLSRQCTPMHGMIEQKSFRAPSHQNTLRDHSLS